MGRRLGFDKVPDCFSLSLCTNACVCIHSVEDENEEDEGKALVSAQLEELLKLKDFAEAKTLAFHLEPKTVELKVSMHCYAVPGKCRSTSPRWKRLKKSRMLAHIRKVEKHLGSRDKTLPVRRREKNWAAAAAGVTSFEVDLENKKVVVTGDVTPYEVLESVSKVMKFAELLAAPNATAATPGR